MTKNISDYQNTKINNYEEAISLVKKEVEKVLTKSPRMIREYTAHLSTSQGKYIRAMSVITCAQEMDGTIHSNAIYVASAIELIHLSSLVHDDIIDNAELRRGKATLQKKYGKRTAVICGDYLLSLALKMLSSVSNKKDYIDLNMPDYISKLCLGELNQHINNHNLNLTIYQYIKIISGKTAALFEASFYSGAVIANYSEKESNLYKKIGNYIGIIFQLTDDCIDFDTTIEVANKPVQSDYEQGVITLPLIHAFLTMPDFKQKAMNSSVTRQEINDAVEKTGGLTFTKILVNKYYKKAMGCINKLDLTIEKKNRIISLLNKASRVV